MLFREEFIKANNWILVREVQWKISKIVMGEN